MSSAVRIIRRILLFTLVLGLVSTGILMIPNLGNRMVREFLEYRPYKAMAQFRREMGSTSMTRRSRGWSSTYSCRST